MRFCQTRWENLEPCMRHNVIVFVRKLYYHLLSQSCTQSRKIGYLPSCARYRHDIVHTIRLHLFCHIDLCWSLEGLRFCVLIRNSVFDFQNYNYVKILRQNPDKVDLQIETIRVNVLGALNLADLCHERGIHLTVYATGCIFHYDDAKPQDSGIGFTEADTPNFTGSYYSKTKVWCQMMICCLSFPLEKGNSKGSIASPVCVVLASAGWQSLSIRSQLVLVVISLSLVECSLPLHVLDD